MHHAHAEVGKNIKSAAGNKIGERFYRTRRCRSKKNDKDSYDPLDP